MQLAVHPIPQVNARRCERSAERIKAELKAHRRAVLMNMLKLLARLALITAFWMAVLWVFVVVLSIIAHGVFAVFGGGFIGQAVAGLLVFGAIVVVDKLCTPSQY